MRTTKSTLDELKKLMEPEGQDDPKLAPLPEFSEVLYAEPMPGGARRNCSNCVLWASQSSQCSIMEPSVTAQAHSVCGYHIPGSPSKQRLNLPGLDPVDPKNAGLLGLVRGGTACENCQHFTSQDEEEGVCAAVLKRGASRSPLPRKAQVHPKGCCTRWQARETPTDPKDG